MSEKHTRSWWKTAVIYQVYPRSFADANGDGVGDLEGFRSRLPYLAELGVDAVWFTPWYPSPLADGGYDVADYRGVDPLIGTLQEAEKLIEDAHALDIRVLLDIVPNHCSSAHRLFRDALEAGPGSPRRALFCFRPGKGADGADPPNNWRSVFGGPAWSRIVEPDGTPGEWYLHLFNSGQPDWNWEHPLVQSDFERTLRFWFDRGIDGFRIDVCDHIAKRPGLPDHDYANSGAAAPPPWKHQPTAFEVYRSWRRIADSYDEPKVLIGELWSDDIKIFGRYVNPDALDSGFNFGLTGLPPRAADLRTAIDHALDYSHRLDAPSPWVLGNHDMCRPATRYGRETHFSAWTRTDERSDLELGAQRARALALLTLALPGNACVYQGEELSLPEVLDIPEDRLRDPIWEQSGHTDRGRDGCRVPLPWEGTQPPFGFSPADASTDPWLPQPNDWAELTASAQAADPNSTLALYRKALKVRRSFATQDFAWLPGRDMLAFRRGTRTLIVVNLGPSPIALPSHTEVLLASRPLAAEDVLPEYAAAWLRI